MKDYTRTTLALMLCLLSDHSSYPQSCPPPASDEYEVTYEAFIPQDHLASPVSSCAYAGKPGSPSLPRVISVPYLYEGDTPVVPNLFSEGFRIKQTYYVYPVAGYAYNYSIVPGETFEFGYRSPYNGSYLSAADQDNKANDCYLFNDAAFTNTNNTLAGVTFGAESLSEAISGRINNPLESNTAYGIGWDLTISVKQTSSSTAQVGVSGSITCYPSHEVFVNGAPVAYYPAPQNPTSGFLLACLGGGLTYPISGSQTVTAR